MTLWVAALGLGASVLLGLSPRLRRRSEPRESVAPDGSALRRWRLPLSFLAGVAVWALLGGPVGAVLGTGGGAVAWRILSRARSPGEVRRDRRLISDYPLVVELLAAALESGADVATAMETVGPAVGQPWCDRLAMPVHALAIGQPPLDVWAELELDSFAGSVGRVLARSQMTGAPVAEAMRALAREARDEADLVAHAYARTVEVKAAAPLGLCFLPAFVLLGVVPMVAGVLGDLAWLGTR